MPRVHHRKARKDYPGQGISKGEMYYATKIKTGPRSGMTLRSKTPFKKSQLTQSPFKSAWYAVEEGWHDSDKDAEAIRAAAEELRSAGEEVQSSLDNMPEGLQEGDTGQMMQNRIEMAEAAADDLESLADELDSLEEPEEVEEPEDEDDEDAQAAYDEYQTDLETYENEKDRILEEVEDKLGDMPE